MGGNRALRKLMVLIDFNNVLFSSYYGQKLINSKGTNVNAVKGFFTKIKNYKDIFEPEYIVFARDISRSKTFRRKIYSGYKANRKPTDPDILTQMKLAQRMVHLLGFPMLWNDGYEADDILGMCAKYGDDHDMDTVIVSSDRDMYQLITSQTSVMPPKGGDLVNIDSMMSEYQLTPDQWIELKMLQGDRSDNIPGIPGIGTKTALILMRRYGTINNIYSHLDEIKQSIRSALESHRKNLPLIRSLVTIERDYRKIHLTLDDLRRDTVFHDEIWDILMQEELYSLFDVMKYGLFPQPHDRLEEKASDPGKTHSVSGERLGRTVESVSPRARVSNRN